ncbi:MAG: protein kinase domain-containing protein [Desulfotignum sp.]
MTDKPNCWEYMRCGREPGGRMAGEKGVCPAAVDQSHDGTNAGTCGGRFCWAVAGTFCHGQVQGSFAGKQEDCLACAFYRLVRAQQGSANIRTKFLKFVPPFSTSRILPRLEQVRISRGTRFITQGTQTPTAYIIEQGSCLELVDKQDGLHPVGHRSEGDIVGMISLLTGEPMGFHVEAETDLEAWAVTSEDFERIPEQDPDLYTFLTELVADRYDRNGPIAERRIGPYLITDIIGKGGYSIVYKALHLELEKPVAVKMLRHHLSMNKDFQDNFKNEAYLIAGLSHPHIIQVYDITSKYKTMFIACEYLTGRSLEQLIADRGKIQPDHAAAYLDQMLSAMAYAARKGLVHRDINPANVMVSDNHQVKLIDFGLACPPGTDDLLMGGNFNYLAPELFDGEPADFRSDMFSLGITVFHMVTGHLPYDTADPAETMKQIRTAPLTDPGKLVKDLPRRLGKFILKACEKDPDHRFQTPDEARQWLTGHSSAAPCPTPCALLPPVFSRRCRLTHGRHEQQDILTCRHLHIAGATHIGLNRKTNQDRYLICLENQLSAGATPGAMLALADGLGGAIGGETAADHVIRHLAMPEQEFSLDLLRRFAEKMDRDICAMAETDPYLNGMGTTLTCAVVYGRTVFWVHSGDSRLYHLKKDRLVRITRDQTLAAFLIREKQITPDQARTHYSRQVLEQYIGCQHLTPLSGTFDAAAGDMILLMSDGCYRHVPPGRIVGICRRACSPDRAADILVKQALNAGGTDNITVIVTGFSPDPAGPDLL